MVEPLLEQVERWYRRGEFGRVTYTCGKALEDPHFAAIRADLLFWKGSAHERAGRAWRGEAISCFREGISLAGSQPAIKVVLIAALGKLYSETGDCPSFEKLFGEFLAITQAATRDIMQGAVYVWYNYGVTLDNASRWEEAAQAYAQAAELAAQHAPSMMGLALHNLGGVQLILGRLPQAATTMARAEELLTEEEAGHKKWSRRAEYFLAAGDLISAQEAVTAALVHPACDDMTRADVCFTWALALEVLGRPAQAQEKALLALDFAVKAVHYPGIHKVNRFLQRSGPPASG